MAKRRSKKKRSRSAGQEAPGAAGSPRAVERSDAPGDHGSEEIFTDGDESAGAEEADALLLDGGPEDEDPIGGEASSGDALLGDDDDDITFVAPTGESAAASGEDPGAASTALVPARGRALADPLSAWMRDVSRFPELDPDEERALARLYRDTGDADAARRLVTANLRLVVKLALMYRRALRNVMDLIQEGNIGLLEALKRYDPEQGVKFSTYASWWIKAYILKFLMDNARLVRVGTTNARRKLIYNLRREQRKLKSQGIDPTPRLLAEKFGVSSKDVIAVDKALSSRDVSVDAPLGEDSRATLADVMAAPEGPVDEQVAAREIREKVEEAISEFRVDLGERERAILDLRLVAEDPATLQALGERFGVTREAMRQAEVKLKTKLAGFLRERLGEEVVLMFSGEN